MGLDEELGNLRLSRLRLKLIKRIKKANKAKRELASKSKSLIKSIESAFEKASDNLDATIMSYAVLLKRFKFSGSEMKIIEQIESFSINVQSIAVDAIATLVQNTYSMYLIAFKKTKEIENNQFFNQYCGGFLCGAITDDCQTLVTGGYDSVIRVWDLVNKKQKFVLLGHNSRVDCIALTEDWQYIISGLTIPH